VIIVDPIGKDNDKGAVYSVPDTGSTLLLLGTAVLVLGIAGRRFAIR
jgi:VPDSG-CTERM motif